MKFHDLKSGMIIKAGPITISEEEILTFARQFDPQWFHTDPERAKSGRWGGLIASGWHTCAITMRMAVDAILHDSDSFGSPGLGEVRWRVPVRPGDALRLEAKVMGVRKSSQRENLGIASWVWTTYNQHGEAVLEVDATNLFELDPNAASSD